MSGETDLSLLLQSLQAELVPGLFVFARWPDHHPLGDTRIKATIQEAEGITAIMAQSDAIALGLDYEFPCCMITLNIHSSLNAVGFIARIATELAKHDIALNPVSGFYHDHLFVPDGQAARVLEILADLAKNTPR